MAPVLLESHLADFFSTLFLKCVPFLIESSTYQREEYCLNYAEEFNFEAKQSKFTKEVHICVNAGGQCSGDYGYWYCLVEHKLMPAIFCISMLFFGFLALYIWSKKKEKLFECMLISCISMLFIVYLILTIDKISGSLRASTLESFI